MSDFRWSEAEKAIARRAYDAARTREYAAMLATLKRMAEAAEGPADIWAIHDHLTEQRRMVDAKYDYRYSVLTMLFSRLVREQWLTEADLEGLSGDKMQAIRRIASL